MENVSHTLCGLALARAGGDRLGPLATPAIVIGANLPDIDAVGMLWGGHTWYLHHHRGLTHSVVGLFALSFLLTACLLAVSRWRQYEGVRPRNLWAAAALGLASHLALDALNTYGVRPWLPFSGTWYYGDIAFILDPWMWLLFGFGAILGSPHREPHHTKTWWALVGVAVLFMLTRTLPQAPPVAAMWGLLMASVLVARWRGAGLERPRRLAGTGIGLAVLYLITLCALDRIADHRARDAVTAQGHTVLSSTTHPQPAVPWWFASVVDVGPTLFEVRVDLGRGTTKIKRSFPTRLDDPALTRIRHTAEFRAWKAFARHPFVAHSEQGELILGDGRYHPYPSRAWCNLHMPEP